MNLKSKIEALLFVSGKPLTINKIGDIVDAKEAEVVEALKELQIQYNQGLQIFSNGKQWQMGTSGQAASVIEKFVKEEFTGELTRPQLETLTVIAYRGPISKLELEVIRGVNCGLILRNLMIRGLVDEEYDSKLKQAKYRISIEFLRHVGISSAQGLPDYQTLHTHEVIDTILQSN